ncbi:hypothetical protein MNB_ARC-1_1143 [hydrothermal vent metagenome]|uniref:Uncharacterized protein n=1 Tax=hydrothermal vent metagenome TaxID=652676 RepID=A0A3B1EAB8_9ZZZZ
MLYLALLGGALSVFVSINVYLKNSEQIDKVRNARSIVKGIESLVKVNAEDLATELKLSQYLVLSSEKTPNTISGLNKLQSAMEIYLETNATTEPTAAQLVATGAITANEINALVTSDFEFFVLTDDEISMSNNSEINQYLTNVKSLLRYGEEYRETNNTNSFKALSNTELELNKHYREKIRIAKIDQKIQDYLKYDKQQGAIANVIIKSLDSNSSRNIRIRHLIDSKRNQKGYSKL